MKELSKIVTLLIKVLILVIYLINNINIKQILTKLVIFSQDHIHFSEDVYMAKILMSIPINTLKTSSKRIIPVKS